MRPEIGLRNLNKFHQKVLLTNNSPHTGILKGVHNLRHTFGRRLRGAGVSLETRKALLGHAGGDITTHYSAADISELMDAAEYCADRGIAQTPTLLVVKRTGESVGKMLEIKKGSAAP